ARTNRGGFAPGSPFWAGEGPGSVRPEITRPKNSEPARRFMAGLRPGGNERGAPGESLTILFFWARECDGPAVGARWDPVRPRDTMGETDRQRIELYCYTGPPEDVIDAAARL